MASPFLHSLPVSLPCSVLHLPTQGLQSHSRAYFPYIAAEDLIDCTRAGFEMDISTPGLVVTMLKDESVWTLCLSPKCDWKKQIRIE